MNIKMIVCDMDGTLLNSNKEISDFTRETLIEAQEIGITLVLASGRTNTTLGYYSDELQMEKYDGYFIASNGISVYRLKTKENKVLKRFTKYEMDEIFDFTKKTGAETIFVSDTTLSSYIPNELHKIKEKYRKENNISDDVPWTSGIDKVVTDYRNLYKYFRYIDSTDDVGLDLNKICVSYPDTKIVQKIEKT